MRLEHLIQGYSFNRISAKISEQMSDEREKAGVIKFSDDINASYLLDNDGFVIAMNLFSNCVITKNRTINNQLEHTIQTLIIIQKTIELQGNTKIEEANNIMRELKMFDGKIEEKTVKYMNHIYRIEIINGFLLFSNAEIKE